MKATRHLLLISLFCSCLLLQNCSLFDFNAKPKTELEKLPRATNTGEGTFGCLVDGKAWVAKSGSWSRPATDAYYQNDVLHISAGLITNNFSQRITMRMVFPNLTEKDYILIDYPTGEGLVEDIRNSCLYETSSTHSGKLTITFFDNINYIISGTFEFECYSIDCDKIVKVTHGRFDLNYAP